MNENVDPDSNVTVERDLHPWKQTLPRFSTEEGMKSDDSDEPYRNAYSPTDESLELDLNVTIERDLPLQKQSRRCWSTEEGMQIDESDEQ
jgi:hypothetical protein